MKRENFNHIAPILRTTLYHCLCNSLKSLLICTLECYEILEHRYEDNKIAIDLENKMKRKKEGPILNGDEAVRLASLALTGFFRSITLSTSASEESSNDLEMEEPELPEINTLTRKVSEF